MINLRNWSKAEKVLLAIFLLMILASLSGTITAVLTRPTAAEMTAEDMLTLKGIIDGFYLESKRLPRSLKEISHDWGFDYEAEDRWGNDFIYTVQDKEVTLTSFGENGVAGGTHTDRDMILKFSLDPQEVKTREDIVDQDRKPFF